MAENPTLHQSFGNGFGDGGGSTVDQGKNRGELTPQQLELQKEIERQQKIFEAVQPKFAEVDVVINALKQAVVKAHAELAVETADIEAKITELKEARQQLSAMTAQDNPTELAERIAENETKQEYLKEELESSRIIWLFNAQVDVFLNSELGKDHVQMWALALMRQNRGQNNGQAEVPTGTDTFVDSHEHTRYLFNLPPGSDTNEELGKFFAELAPNENDEENLATINALLAGDPELFRKVSADVLVVQQKLRADIGLSGAVEQNEERHLKKVGENIHAVLPNNPLAELVGFVHDAHKFRKSLDGQRVEMNLFLHEEASAVAGVELLIITLRTHLEERGVDGVEELLATVRKIAKIAILLHGLGEFPAIKAGLQNKHLPVKFRNLLGIPRIGFGGDFYPFFPMIRQLVDEQLVGIFELVATLNAADAATGCLVESFAKNNSYANDYIIQRGLVTYITEDLTDSFEGNLRVDGATILQSATEDNARLVAARDNFSALTLNLREHKRKYVETVQADSALLATGGDVTNQERTRQYQALAESFAQLEAAVGAKDQEQIKTARSEFNKTLTVYIIAIAREVGSFSD